MNKIFIKLYIPQSRGDYHDLCIDEHEKTIKKMKKFAQSKGQYLFFVAISTDTFPVQTDVIAEVEYTEELDDECRATYIKYLKLLSRDADFNGKELDVYDTLLAIKFTKVNCEVVFCK